jgi:hypothetical protein
MATNGSPSTKVVFPDEGSRLVAQSRGRTPHVLWEDGSASAGRGLNKVLRMNPDAKLRGDGVRVRAAKNLAKRKMKME